MHRIPAIKIHFERQRIRHCANPQFSRMETARMRKSAGPMESRAWTVTAGTPAPEAAGKIHTDLQRGFIRMETVSYDDMVACGGWNKAKEQGKLRVEGKEYLMQDGDVIHVRFSV